MESYADCCLFNGDYKVGFELLNELRDMDNYMVNSFLKLCYENGIGVEANKEEVLKFENKLKNNK